MALAGTIITAAAATTCVDTLDGVWQRCRVNIDCATRRAEAAPPDPQRAAGVGIGRAEHDVDVPCAAGAIVWLRVGVPLEEARLLA